MLTDTSVKERITAGGKSCIFQESLSPGKKGSHRSEKAKSKRHVSRQKSCSWSDDFDVDEPVYNNSSDFSMDVDDEPPTTNFLFEIEISEGVYSFLKTEVEIKLQPLTGGTSRFVKRFTFGGDQSTFNLK